MVLKLLAMTPCPAGKHKLYVDSYYPGHFSTLKCVRCNSFKVLSHEVVVELLVGP